MFHQLDRRFTENSTINHLLKHTQDRYKIVLKKLAIEANISPSYLSDIRTGKSWPSQEVLQNILQAMEKLAPGSRAYFCAMLAGVSLESLVVAADETEIVALLEKIVDRLKQELVTPNA